MPTVYTNQLNTELPEIRVTPNPEETPPDQIINVAPETVSPPLKDEYVSQRSFKAAYGLSDILKKSQTQIFQQISAGEEKDLRDEASANIAYRKELATQEALKTYAKNKQGNLTLQDVEFVTKAIQGMQDSVDPETVFEESWGREYIKALERASERTNKLIQNAASSDPVLTENDLIRGRELAAKAEYANTISENLKTVYDAQSWAGWTVDQLKMMVPGYQDIKMRGNVENSPFKLGLGQQLEEQGKALFNKPFSEFKTEFKSIVDNLAQDNPTLAVMFAEYVKGMSTSSITLDTLFPIIDYATIPAGPISKAALAGKAKMFNENRTAVKTMLERLEGTDVSKDTILAAAGDLKEAAIAKETANIAEEVTKSLPDETKRAVEALPSALRTDIADLKSNPGRYQELVNRMAEQKEGRIDELVNVLTTTQQVDRLPFIHAAETTARMVSEYTLGKYPGISNRVADFSLPKFDPITGNRTVEAIITDSDVRFFASRETAENFARSQGWMTPVIESRAGVPVGPASGYTKTQIAKMASLRKAIREAEDVTIPRQQKRAADTNLDKATRAKAQEQVDGLIDLVNQYKRELDVFNQPAKKAPKPVKTVYVPKAAVRRDWETLPRVGEITVQKKGRNIHYFTDDGAEVKISTKPDKDTVPLHLYKNSKDPSGYNVVIGKPLSTDEDVVKTTVEQQGVGFYIKRSFPVRETDDFIRSLMEKDIQTEGSLSAQPRSMINAFIGRIRSPEDTMSLAQRENRKTTTYAPSRIVHFFRDAAKDIQELKGWTGLRNKQRWKDFNRVLTESQKLIDPDTKQPGYFFKNPVELDNFYQTHIKRLPDEQEVRAYFSFKEAMEMDRIFRNVQEHMFQGRQGAETHEIFALNEKGLRKGSGEFSGVVHRHLPGGKDNILVMNKTLGEEKILNLAHLGKKPREEYEELIRSGKAKLIELYAPEQRPLKGFSKVAGDTRIRYVLTESSETKPLTWNHVNRRGGGHVDYEYEHYIKQAIIRKQYVGSELQVFYEGDQTIGAVGINALGEDAAAKLDHIRDLLRLEDEAGARKYANAVFSKNADDVINWFKETVGEDGVKRPPRLNLETKIQVVSRNKKISEGSKDLEKQYGDSFRDGTKSGSLSQQFQVEYNKMRDDQGLVTFKNEGTADNPLYDIAPAERIDPISTMNRALGRIANSNFMNSYKIFSIEHWLAQAAPFMKATDSQIRSAPFMHFSVGPRNFRADAPQDLVARLTTEHMQIQQLVGIPSTTDNLINAVSQKLADSIYERVGQKASERLTPKWALPFVKDPVNFIKSVTFDTNLGLFNPVQFIVQSMNYVNVVGIAGVKNGLSGMYAAQLHLWSRVNSNPQIIDHLDKLASKLNMPGLNRWKPGEFKEAMEELDRTGFANVGREYAVLDDLNNETIVDSAGRTFLESGRMFFKGGERNARYGAWYTAFKEWREANPFVKIGNKERSDILERADLLNVNMSRASSSVLHRGIFSVPMQFLTYQLRVTELMLGKRLTTAERVRLFGVNALMYGIPASTGIFGWPFAENMRQSALENGYVVGDSFLESLVTEGIPATLLSLATGTHYNVADRYAAKGFDTFTKLFNSDAKVWEIFGGAAFSKFADIWESTHGMFAAAGSIMREDDKHFPMKVEDFLGPLRTISSVNAAARLYEAIQTHKWATKRGEPLTDVSPLEAIFQTATGLSNQRISDIGRQLASMKDNKARWQEAEKNFLTEMRRYFKALEDNDPSNAKDYMIRAKVWLDMAGYPQERLGSIFGRAYRENENITDRIDMQFYLKQAPDNQFTKRLDAYQRLQRKNNPENK